MASHIILGKSRRGSKKHLQKKIVFIQNIKLWRTRQYLQIYLVRIFLHPVIFTIVDFALLYIFTFIIKSQKMKHRNYFLVHYMFTSFSAIFVIKTKNGYALLLTK